MKSVTRTLQTIGGVRVTRETKVALGSAAVAYDPAVTAPEYISNALGKAGYAVDRIQQVEDHQP